MVNDDWTDQNYDFGDDQELNDRISKLINEFCHVFRCHADGNWKTNYKPNYVSMMAKEVADKPSLIRKLLNLIDPVVSNITYSAIEHNKQQNVN